MDHRALISKSQSQVWDYMKTLVNPQNCDKFSNMFGTTDLLSTLKCVQTDYGFCFCLLSFNGFIMKGSSLYSLCHKCQKLAQCCVVSAHLLFIVCGTYEKQLCWETHYSANVATYWTLEIHKHKQIVSLSIQADLPV